MNFPERLKKLRKDKNITQEELAKAIYVSRTLISKYENGSTYPTKENAEKLALYFNVDLAELIDNDDTAQLVLKQNDVSNKIHKVLPIIIASISALFSCYTFIPCLKVRYYDYTNGAPPNLIYKIYTPIQLSLKNSNPIVLITLIALLGNIVISILSLVFKKNKWLKLANYILSIINLLLMFFAIVFSVMYCSNNLYDY